MKSNSDVLATNHSENMSKWAMDGMHRRRLSLLDKWASDKSMAIGYLRRQREVISWIESVLKCEFSSTDLLEALKSGVVLRELMEFYFPDASDCMPPTNRTYSKRMAPWKERENISVFLRQCKSIGMNDLSLFCTDDLYEVTDMVQVLFCLERFKMYSEDHACHHSKCVSTNEPAEFSNQELEMSKSEQAEVGVTASKRSDSSSVLPEDIEVSKKESVTREASELNFMSSKDKKLESVSEEELAKGSDEKVIVEVQTEECNQVSEDKPDVDNPADADDVNFRQSSGSDVSDEQQATQAEDIFVLMQTMDGDLPLVQNEEIRMTVHPVDLGMEAKNEKPVARSLAKQDVPTIETEYEAPIDEVAIALVEVLQVTTTEPATDLAVKMKTENEGQLNCKSEVSAAGLVSEEAAETENQTNVENEVTAGTENPAARLRDAPIESTLAEDVASAQPSAENAQPAVEEQEEVTPQPTEAEILEANTMAKCSCGRCTIM